MNRIDTLREQIDAVRPDSDDLSLPGLAALAQAADTDRAVADELDRSQRFDRTVASALHDVPVPQDLLDRLLAKAAAAAPVPAVAAEPASLSQPHFRVTRRAVLALVSLAAAALLAAGIGMYWPRPGRDVSQAELSEAALAWYDQIPVAEGWTAVADQARFRAQIPASVVRTPSRWRQLQTEHGPAVVYDLAAPGRPRALLFAVRTPDEFAVAPVPFSVVTATRGKAIGAWQSGNMLYVLVIDRDRQRLEDHIRRRPEA